MIPDVALHLILLVNLAADGGDELAGIGLTEGVEGVALVHGEEGEPLLQHVVQVGAHVRLCLGQLVAEGKAYTNIHKLPARCKSV
jgi:hypothetical protein